MQNIEQIVELKQPHQPLPVSPIQIIKLDWNFTIPPESDQTGAYYLLTIAGVAVYGHWLGDLGEFFVAWAYHSNCGQVH